MKHETDEEGKQTMKKRISAYAAVAVLLGLAMTVLPLAIENQQTNQSGGLFPTSLYPRYASAPQTGSQNAFQSPTGLLAQPTSLLPSSLILFSGLAVALGVYVILKKRTM